MTTGLERDEQERCAGCLLRRVVLTILAVYLAPVALIVLLIGGLGMVCCAVARWFEPGPTWSGSGLRRAEQVSAVAPPHVSRLVRSQLPGR